MDYSALQIVDAYDVTCARNYGQTGGLEPELVAKLLAETGYHKLEEAPKAANYGMAEQIGLGKIPCPWCKWNTPNKSASGRRVLLAVEGDNTGVQVLRHYPCRCKMYEKMYSRWSGPYAMVPKDYREFRLGKLVPSPYSRLSITDQEDVIRGMNLNPTRNFLFVGPAGTSKTVFTTALFSNALYDWAENAWRKQCSTEAVWRVVVSDYLQQELDYDRKRELKVTDGDGNESYVEPKEPIVTRRKIREACAAGLVPRLFLEEIDKVPNLTRGRMSNLFGICNEIAEQGGQLVVNSNMTIPKLVELFGEDTGEAMLRRFKADDLEWRGMTYNFYSDSYTVRP